MDDLIVAACRYLEQNEAAAPDKIDEKKLLSAQVYDDRVAVVIASGQKFVVQQDVLAPAQPKPKVKRSSTRKK